MRKVVVLLILLIGGFSVKAQEMSEAELYYEQAMDLLSRQDDPMPRDSVNAAIKLYIRAIEANSLYSPAYQQLVVDYWSLDNKTESWKYLDKALQVIPEKSVFYLIKGILKEDLEEIDEANKYYQLAVDSFDKADMRTFDDIFNRSLAYYLLENQDTALAKFKESANWKNFSEEDKEGYYQLGIELLETVDLMELIQSSMTNKYGFKE